MWESRWRNGCRESARQWVKWADLEPTSHSMWWARHWQRHLHRRCQRAPRHRTSPKLRWLRRLRQLPRQHWQDAGGGASGRSRSQEIEVARSESQTQGIQEKRRSWQAIKYKENVQFERKTSCKFVGAGSKTTENQKSSLGQPKGRETVTNLGKEKWSG